MAAEQRTHEDIRSELSAERENLVDAVADLRAGLATKRRLATVIGMLVAVGLASTASVRAIRRFRGG